MVADDTTESKPAVPPPFFLVYYYDRTENKSPVPGHHVLHFETSQSPTDSDSVKSMLFSLTNPKIKQATQKTREQITIPLQITIPQA